MHFPHPHMPPRNCRVLAFFTVKKNNILNPLHMHKTHSQESILGTHRTFLPGLWDSSQECFWERTLHFVELRASGPDIGDDLSTVMSAEGGRRVYLGVTPPPWLWVLGMGKNPMESREARLPQEGSSLMAQVNWVQELRTLQLDVRPRGKKGCWVQQRDARPKISKRWHSEILNGHPLTKTEFF